MERVSNETTPLSDLILEAIDGPNIDPIHVSPASPAVIGRAKDCQVTLMDQTVSRQHAEMYCRDRVWYISDLGGRNGIELNGVRLPVKEPAQLAQDDLCLIGPWTFRIIVNPELQTSAKPTEDGTSNQIRVERVKDDQLGSLAQHRLERLIDCAARINAAENVNELASVAAEDAVQGSGYHRAALVAAANREGKVTVLGVYDSDGRSDVGSFDFSRSLLEEASSGHMACMMADRAMDYGQSIADLNIHSALCAPVHIGSSVAAFLYLDARGRESEVLSDAMGFCQAVARILGLAMANFKRLELERRQKSLEVDLAAAREAQQFMTPADEGSLHGLTYASMMRPGRHASGDLFDFVSLPDDRVAVLVGDVSGKGVGAAILMAAAQSFLHATLVRYGDPGEAVTQLNRYVAQRSALNRFLSLWVGVIDVASSHLSYVDAGHGHWLRRRADGTVWIPDRPTGLLVGIEEESQYKSHVTELVPGERIILFSDGVVEQPDLNGNQFGMSQVVEIVSGNGTPLQDIETIITRLQSFAERPQLADDTTIVSVAFG